MSTERTRELVRELYEAYSTGDVAGVYALLDPDVTFTIVGPADVLPFYGTWRGRQATLSALGKIAEIYEVLSYRVIELLADGDKAAVRSLGAFRHRATRRTVELEIADFLRIEDGLVVELREINDSLGGLRDSFGLDVAALVPTRSV